jgi:hypothetical protein
MRVLVESYIFTHVMYMATSEGPGFRCFLDCFAAGLKCAFAFQSVLRASSCFGAAPLVASNHSSQWLQPA